MIETKIFAGGGMNTDDSPSYIAQNDYVEAFNLVLAGNVEGEEGDITDLPSTVEILGYTLPAGINKCVGAERFENERKIYALIYNSFGYHQLVEYDYDINLMTLLFTNLTDSNGVDVLGLTSNNYVSDIKLVDDILIFTDSNIRPASINVARLKNGGYGVLTIDDFKLVKAQPLKIPKVRYGDDSGRVVNYMKQNLFQYRYIYNYLDNEPSVYSSISKREVPESESTTSIGEDVTKNNHQVISVHIGTNRVKDIDIAARYSNYDWFTIRSVKRDYVLSLPDTQVDVEAEIYEAYDPATGEYSFAFYNDGSYVNINPVETDTTHDYIPHKAETLELLVSNKLVLGGLTEGYERPVVDVTVESFSYDPNLVVPTPSYDNLVISYIFPGSSGSGEGDHRRRMQVEWGGLPKSGDKLTIVTADIRDANNTRTFEYTVPPTQEDDLAAVVASFQAIIPNSYVQVSTVNPAFRGIVFVGEPYQGLKYTTVELATVGSGVLKSVPALKSNSAYQVALQYYDRYGEPFPLITGDNFIVKTNSYAQTKGLTPAISWRIQPEAPEGAVSYQWLLSENTTHQTTLFINAKYLRTEGDYLVLSIDPLKTFNKRNSSSVLNYEYSQGDRVTFMYYDDGGNKVYFDDPYIDVQVVGFEIVIDTAPDPDTETYELKVRRNPSINISDIQDHNIYIEIYSPKKRVVVDGDTTSYLTTLFYEIGEQFNIINGLHEQLTGTITTGDIYFQTRDYVSAVDGTTYNTYLAEDFNFSAVYESKYTSYGRAFQYNDRDGVKIRKAGIRYSDAFVLESKTNMLNRFYGERLYGDGDGESSSTFGWIRKLRQRDNYLVCIQEVKVGHIPVFNTIVEDQTGREQAFLSDKILDKIRYSQTGNIGMGNAQECYCESPSGTIYFQDPNNSIPMREGYDGLRKIDGKMSKFFKNAFQKYKQQGRPTIAYWNDYIQDAIYSTQEDEDIVTSIPLTEANLVYLDNYVVNASDITIVSQPVNAVVALESGQWVITPNTGATGAGSFSYSFVVAGQTIQKNLCFTIIAGDSTIFPFNFVDLVDQELSTLVTSNSVLIGGINIAVPISITGGQYSINGGAWTSANGTVVNNDEVRVRQTTSALSNTTTSAVLTVSGYSDSFDATTRPDNIPDPFTFAPVVDADLSTEYVSEVKFISGIDVPVPISVNTGKYAINGGAFTNVAGTVVNGDYIELQLESSSMYDTTNSMIVTVSSYSTSFEITTASTSVIACGVESAYTGGESYPTDTIITLGSATGLVTLTYDAIGVPDKFIVEFDGVEVINTGYRGDMSEQTALDAALASRGLPPEPIVGGPSGTASFTKGTATTTALVRVYAPITGTSWNFTVSCPA